MATANNATEGVAKSGRRTGFAQLAHAVDAPICGARIDQEDSHGEHGRRCD
jgi:hypothetical protein